MVRDPADFSQARSILIAPAVRADFLAKLPSRGADLLFIDCEDAVPAAAKNEARSLAAEATTTLGEQGCAVVVRVNATESEWFGGDVAGLSSAVAGVVIPKIETLEQIDAATSALDRAGLTAIGIVAGLETALGVYEARHLLQHDRIVAAYFGAEDLIADLGGVRTESNDEVASARALTALAARIANKPLWDQVVTDFRNNERFSREATEARNMGYVGKLCIHPAQVTLARDAFTPSKDEVDQARRLLAAYEEASAGGLAAIDFEGRMVDEPLAIQARRLLDRVRE